MYLSLIVCTGAAVLAILFALKRSERIAPVPDEVVQPHDESMSEVTVVPQGAPEDTSAAERNLTLVTAESPQEDLDEHHIADMRAMAEHHADLMENVRRYLRDDLEKLPRQPLFVIARERGVPTRQTIVMSREELIDAINQLDSTAHAG
jgi:hypothetical protein